VSFSHHMHLNCPLNVEVPIFNLADILRMFSVEVVNIVAFFLSKCMYVCNKYCCM
jgi:hypothetical protein